MKAEEKVIVILGSILLSSLSFFVFLVWIAGEVMDALDLALRNSKKGSTTYALESMG